MNRAYSPTDIKIFLSMYEIYFDAEKLSNFLFIPLPEIG
jgi:hypothetical protein